MVFGARFFLALANHFPPSAGHRFRFRQIQTQEHPLLVRKVADEPPRDPTAVAPMHATSQVVSAWIPWVLLTVFVLLWGIPQVKTLLGAKRRQRG